MSGADRMTPPQGNPRRCELCTHWLAEHAKRIAMLPGGGVPVADLIAKGAGVPPNAIIVNMAACTVHPTWIQTADVGYCGQFKKREAS